MLQAVGTLMIFCSWLADNHFGSRWVDDRIRLDRSQLAIDVQEVREEHWRAVYLDEVSKEHPSRTRLGEAGMRYIEANQNLSVWGALRVADDPAEAESFKRRRDSLRVISRMFVAQGRLDSLAALIDRITMEGNRNQESVVMTQMFFAKVNEVTAKRDLWRDIFFWSFVAGSVLLAIGWVASQWSGVTETGGGAA